MNKYKLTFHLKQHTPMIHFQADQHGATLRATELKPKLDRFLIEKLGLTEKLGVKEKEVPKNEFKDWFISKQHLALNYRVKITATESTMQKGSVEIMPSTTEQTVLHGEIKVEFICQILKLKQKIEDHYCPFFALHNFGKRQGKGFGSFYPEGKSQREFESDLLQTNSYKWNNQMGSSNHLNNNFYSIEIVNKWGKLKSGVNRFWGDNPKYTKSAVFSHLESGDLRWDKRWIKRQLKSFIQSGNLGVDLMQRAEDPIDLKDVNSWNDTTNEEYRFGRALLGLAEHYEYKTTNPNVVYKVVVNGGDVDRFQSPLMFKVFGKSIYAFINEQTEHIYDKSFSFKVQKKVNRRNEWRDDGNPIDFPTLLKTPKLNEFELEAFFDEYLPTVGFNKLT